jgi:hypothetical protein
MKQLYRLPSALFALALLALALLAPASVLFAPLAAHAQQAITPVVQCVQDLGGGQYAALFGYTNTTGQQYTILGVNSFSPGPAERGQPSVVNPKGKAESFAVVWDGSPLTWTMNHPQFPTRSATAEAGVSPSCEAGRVQPVVPIPGCLTANGDGTFNAHFGFTNPNAFPVYVPQGALNELSAPVAYGAVRTTFAKGQKLGSVIVTWDGSPLTWSLMGSSATVEAGVTAMCQPVTPIATCVAEHPDGSYDATFGYSNPNPHPVKVEPNTPENDLQPIGVPKAIFAAKTVARAFMVQDAQDVLTWLLMGDRAQAGLHRPRCGASKAEADGSISEPVAEEEDVTEIEMASAARAAAAPDGVPSGFALSPAYPNPFNPATSITFTLPSDGAVRLVVYDAMGREVAVLFDGHAPAGEHQARFDAAGLPSGVYLYRLVTEGGTLARTMTLLK